MDRNEGLYDFGIPFGDDLRQGLPPIVGDEGGSVWLGGEGHIEIPALSVPTGFSEGMYFGVDFQPDSRLEHVVLGTVTSSGSALRMVVNEKNIVGRLSVLLRDEDGHRLSVHVQGSKSIARRVIVSAVPRLNQIEIYEIQPWAMSPCIALQSDVSIAEAPSQFAFDKPLMLGGSHGDRTARGSSGGRVANFFVGAHALAPARVGSYAEASTNPMSLANGDLGEPSREMCARFLRDVQQLRD